MGIFWGYDHFHPYKIAKTLKNFQSKNFPKMLRISRSIMGIFFGLRSFSPIQNGQNTWKLSDKKISGNDHNVEIYHGNFFGLTIIFTHTNWPKHLKIIRQKIFRKCSECWDLSWQFFWGYDHFHPYKMAKTLVKILRQKIFRKCSERQHLSWEFFWG